MFASASSGLAASASSSQKTRRRSGGQRLHGRDLRNPDHAALFASLNRVGAQTLQIDAGDLGVPCDDGPQAARAHFDRLLRHIVEPRVLERSEQIVDVRRCLLGPCLRAHDERSRLARARSQAGGEFAVMAVEQKDGSACGQPQDVDEIIRLLRFELELGARDERLGDVKPGGLEIGSSHALP
jgi:hypothetical protein